LIKEFGDALEENLVKDLCCGKINGENLDIRVNTNDIRMTNRDKNYYVFCIKFCYGQIKTRSISQSPNIPAVSHEDINFDKFITSDTEVKCIKTVSNFFLEESWPNTLLDSNGSQRYM
jgi:hypothetical protein